MKDEQLGASELFVPPLINAIFFDFDGVVVDSEPLHAKTKILVLDHFGINYPSHILDKYKGRTEDDFFAYVSEYLDPKHRSPEEFRKKRHQYLSELLPKLTYIEGFQDFITFIISTKALKTALVTSSTIEEIRNIDTHLPVFSLFDLVVSADQTLEHKPHPAPYLRALSILQAKPELSMVIEDSLNGIRSGKKAGCTVCALTTSFSEDELRCAEPHHIFDSYAELQKSMKFL